MGTGYSMLPTADDNDIFAEQAMRDLKTRRSKSTIFNRQPTVRPALHSDAINSLAAVRPGMVISGSSDRSVIVHNMDTGEAVNKWTGHEAAVTKVLYKHVGGKHFVLSGSRDTTVHLWRFNVPNPMQIYRGHDMTVSGLALVDDSKFVSGGRDNSIRLWDVESSKPIRSVVTNRNLVTHLEKSPHENIICQTSEDRTLRYEVDKRMSEDDYSPLRHQILWHCNLSTDEPYCLTSSGGSSVEGCEVTLWDLRKHDVVRELRGHEDTVRSAIFLPQQVTWKRLILSVSNDHTVRIWNQEDGQCLWTETIPTTADLNSCVGFPDGTVVVGGDQSLLCGMKLHGKAGRPLLFCSSVQSRFHTEYELKPLDRKGVVL